MGISTSTPRRASLYARSPPIFTADAAGIGSSISPRRRSSRRPSSSSAGGACRSTTSPSGSPVDVRHREIDLGEVALVQSDETWRKLSCPTGQQKQEPGRERIERPGVAGPCACHPPDLRDDREGGRAARLVDERDAGRVKCARWHVGRGSLRGSARRSLRSGRSVENPAAWRCPPPPKRRAIAETSSSSMLERSDPLYACAASFSCSRTSTASSAPSTARR